MATQLPNPAILTAKQYASLLTGDRVKVIIGLEEKVFNLPKDLLTWVSPFIDAAVHEDEKEKNAVVILDSVTVKSFELALTVIFAIDAEKVRFDVKNFEDNAECITAMIDLAYLGQILQMPALDQLACAHLKGLILDNSLPLTSAHIVHAFTLLDEQSKTRETLVDTAFWHFQQREWEARTNDLTKDWKYGEAMILAPAFGHAILLKARNLILSRNSY